MSLIQRAKVDIVLIKVTLAQTETLKAKKQGGLDNVVKCLISKIIDEISKNYQQFKKT